MGGGKDNPDINFGKTDRQDNFLEQGQESERTGFIT